VRKFPADKRHPHALKHSCGTHLLEKLGDITLVQDWLGHKDIKSTMEYAKVVNPSAAAVSPAIAVPTLSPLPPSPPVTASSPPRAPQNTDNVALKSPVRRI